VKDFHAVISPAPRESTRPLVPSYPPCFAPPFPKRERPSTFLPSWS
jgi:hypothetical protein